MVMSAWGVLHGDVYIVDLHGKVTMNNSLGWSG